MGKFEDYQRIREDFESDGVDATDDMIHDAWEDEQRDNYSDDEN